MAKSIQELITDIRADIRTNGMQQITGDKLGDRMVDIVETMSEHRGGGSNLTGYVALESISELPLNPTNPTLGYLIGLDLYVYVGTGGDVADGKYKNCGQFKGEKGATGATGATGEKGEPGEKGDKGDQGEQGNTGSSVDYPFEIVNNLTEGGADKALSAEMGKRLNDKIDGATPLAVTKTPTTTLRKDGRYYSDANVEAIKDVDVSGYTKVRISTALWISDQSSYDSAICLYDASKVLLKAYTMRNFTTSTAKGGYNYDGVIETEGAAFVSFANMSARPSSSTTQFVLQEPSIYGFQDGLLSEKVYDDGLFKNQKEINRGFDEAIYGKPGDPTEITEDDLNSGNYESVSVGSNTRGRTFIYLQDYPNEFVVAMSVASGSPIKGAIQYKNSKTWSDMVMDSGWITAGMSKSYTGKIGTYTIVSFVFTYTSNTGVPTIAEIQQYISFSFKTGEKTKGIIDRINDLESKESKASDITSYSSSLGLGYSYAGDRIALDEQKFSTELLGTVASGGNYRQGGAVYGNYLFQFHTNNAAISVFDLDSKTNVQIINLTANTHNHAGSGGFGKAFYNASDLFPLLYISSMDEKKVYVYRISGQIGSLSASLIQTITLSCDFYLPNIAIDTNNGRMVIFGYTQNSWSVASSNESVICWCPIPGYDNDVTVSEFFDEFKIPFIYAEQGAFARYGKLFLSFGNTSSMGGIIVIDYLSKSVRSFVDIASMGSLEPEAFCYYDNGAVMTTQSGSVYKLTFV